MTEAKKWWHRRFPELMSWEQWETEWNRPELTVDMAKALLHVLFNTARSLNPRALHFILDIVDPRSGGTSAIETQQLKEKASHVFARSLGDARVTSDGSPAWLSALHHDKALLPLVLECLGRGIYNAEEPFFKHRDAFLEFCAWNMHGRYSGYEWLKEQLRGHVTTFIRTVLSCDLGHLLDEDHPASGVTEALEAIATEPNASLDPPRDVIRAARARALPVQSRAARKLILMRALADAPRQS